MIASPVKYESIMDKLWRINKITHQEEKDEKEEKAVKKITTNKNISKPLARNLENEYFLLSQPIQAEEGKEVRLVG